MTPTTNPAAERAAELRKLYAGITEHISQGRDLQLQLASLGVPREDRRRQKLARDLMFLDDAKCRISEALQDMGEA